MPTEPITADNVYINGNAYRATDAAWLGLDFSRAIHARDDSGPIANVLRVPWVHPEDRARGLLDWSKYRLRPRDPLALFQKIDFRWMLVK